MLAFPLPVPIRPNMPTPQIKKVTKVSKVPKVKAKAKTGDTKKGDGTMSKTSKTSKQSSKPGVTWFKHVQCKTCIKEMVGHPLDSGYFSKPCCSRIESV